MVQEKKFRHERKFIVPMMSPSEIRHLILHHSAMFSEIFHERKVNNIYLDFYGMTNYHENLAGQAQRIKIRIRWYEGLFGEIKNPVLELKIKMGELGRKRSFKLQSFVLDRNFTFEKLQKEVFEKSNLPVEVMELLKMAHPVLLSSYTRRYFRSGDKKYRITLDNNLSFYRIKNRNNSFREKFTDNYMNILELKYLEEKDSKASKITSGFPFRLTASSKYIYGIDLLAL